MSSICFTPARPTAGAFEGFIESFILTRVLLAFSPFLTWIDVVTDIVATVEFASPLDGGGTEKWWTAWSSLFLYLAFRAGLMRYFEFKNRSVPLTFSNLLILIVPFMLNYKFKTNTRATVIQKEIAIMLFFPFYPFILLWEIIGLVGETWRQTANGQGVPFGVIELAVLEIVESMCQFSLQTRAYTLHSLDPVTYYLSGGFSLFSILRAVYTYWSCYLNIKIGPPRDGVWDCSMQGLKLLPKCLNAISVERVVLDRNCIKNVTEGNWNTFFGEFPYLTELSLVGCELAETGAVALEAALKRNQGLVDLNLENNKINNVGVAALVAGLSANAMISFVHLRKKNITDGFYLELPKIDGFVRLDEEYIEYSWNWK